MQQYRDTYINRDIAKLFSHLNRVKYQRFIRMLAQLSGTILNKSEIGRILEFNESTARDYLHIANHTFIWREILSSVYSSTNPLNQCGSVKRYFSCRLGMFRLLLKIECSKTL